jgi:hypothetical protein
MKSNFVSSLYATGLIGTLERGTLYQCCVRIRMSEDVNDNRYSRNGPAVRIHLLDASADSKPIIESSVAEH